MNDTHKGGYTMTKIRIAAILALYAKLNGADFFCGGVTYSGGRFSVAAGETRTDAIVIPINVLPKFAKCFRVTDTTDGIALQFHSMFRNEWMAEPTAMTIATAKGEVKGTALEELLAEAIGGQLDVKSNRAWWEGADVYSPSGKGFQCKGKDGTILISQIRQQAEAAGLQWPEEEEA